MQAQHFVEGIDADGVETYDICGRREGGRSPTSTRSCCRCFAAPRRRCSRRPVVGSVASSESGTPSPRERRQWRSTTARGSAEPCSTVWELRRAGGACAQGSSPAPVDVLSATRPSAAPAGAGTGEPSRGAPLGGRPRTNVAILFHFRPKEHAPTGHARVSDPGHVPRFSRCGRRVGAGRSAGPEAGPAGATSGFEALISGVPRRAYSSS